jgi:hypothetical protein
MNRSREILNELGAAELKYKLLSLPGKMEEQKQKIRQLREISTEKEQVRALKEAMIMSEVVSETNPNTGKPAFSNDTARNTEKLRRLATDVEYQQIAKEAKESEMTVNAAQDELDGLYNEFKAAQYVSQLIGAEVALVANVLLSNVMEPDGQLGQQGQSITGFKKAQAY